MRKELCEKVKKRQSSVKGHSFMVYNNYCVVRADILPNWKVYENTFGVVYEVSCPVSSSECYWEAVILKYNQFKTWYSMGNYGML